MTDLTQARTGTEAHHIGSLTNWARRLLYAQAMIDGLAVPIVLLMGSEPLGPYGAVALVQSGLFIVTAIVILRWIYFACTNAVAMGARDMMVTPGWAVGVYFVPVANLVMPFQSMREIWKGSTRPQDWEIVKAPAVIAWWWLFWLTSNIAGILAGVLEERAIARPGELVPVTAASNLLSVGACLLLARIIGAIWAKQRLAAKST